MPLDKSLCIALENGDVLNRWFTCVLMRVTLDCALMIHWLLNQYLVEIYGNCNLGHLKKDNF